MNPLKTSLPPVLQEPAIPATPAHRKLTDKDIAALKQSCQDFEAIFIQSMFKSMRKAIPDGGLFTRDTAHEIYQEMLDSEIASKISKNQSMGLADQIYRQMKKNFLPDSEKK